MYSFVLSIAVLKAVLFYYVIRLVSAVNFSKPFSDFAFRQILTISYFTLSIGLLSYLGRKIAVDLQQKGIDTQNLSGFWVDSQAYILMAAVVYAIAQIFKRGLELQQENELTV